VAYGMALGRIGSGFGGPVWQRCLVAVLIELGLGVALQSLRRIADLRWRLSMCSLPDTRVWSPSGRLMQGTRLDARHSHADRPVAPSNTDRASR
jgi:hypothetical protein